MGQIKKSFSFSISADNQKVESDYIIREIKVGVIDEDAMNDEIYDEDIGALQELVNDINSVGLCTPLTVRRNQLLSDRYTLIAGHRRLKAAKLLGHKTAPCLVISTESEEDCLKADVMHLTSNIMTRDRSILERAREASLLKERIRSLKKIDSTAYKGKTDDIVAKMMKVSSSYVRQLVRIDSADENIKKMLSEELIGISQALQIQSLGKFYKDEVVAMVRCNNDESESGNLNKAGLIKEIASIVEKEKTVDEIINDDLNKIDKLVVRIASNIYASDSCFENEIEKIIGKLQRID